MISGTRISRLITLKGITLKKLKIILLLAAIIITAIIPLWSNMRAPFIRTYEGGRNLKKAENLVVLHESIEFRFEKYFTGKVGDAMKFSEYSSVNVKYLVRSGNAAKCSFSFLAPSEEVIEIDVNGKRCSHTSILVQGDPKSGKPGWNSRIKILYEIKFDGELIEGDNSISVSYRQPLCLGEISYGYFRSSRWSVSAPYEFAPIKEWSLDKNFRADITLLVPYSYGISDSIFGADIELNCFGFTGSYQKVEPVRGKQVHKERYLARSFTFSGTLPDSFTVSVSEK